MTPRAPAVAPLWRDHRVRWGASLLGVLTLACLLGPLVAADPSAQPDPVAMRELAPTWSHPLGTDGFSRDVLSRLLHGGRTSLGIALLAMLVATAVGGAWGLGAAFAPAPVDALLMRTVDALFAVPRVLLAVVVIASVGPMPPAALAVLLGGTAWLSTARMVRAEARAQRARPYVLAARALGCSEWTIARRHVLPAVLPLLAVTATFTLAATVPLEAGLAFLGLGVRPPAASWGNILLEGAERPAALWWMVLAPAGALAVTIVAAHLLGEGLRATLARRTEPT